MVLVTEVYLLTGRFPDEEKFGLTSQIRRSTVSIPSNIAEGYGRNYRNDYIRFLQIARGSLYECQTQLEIAVNLNYLDADLLKEVRQLGLEVEKMLNSLITKLGTS